MKLISDEDSWETECPNREDKAHCEHWYDGARCCACGEAMDFGQALRQLTTLGSPTDTKIARSGWNGKGMYIVLQKGYPNGIAINKNTSEATGIPVGTVCKFHPYLLMKGVDGSFFPWNPNQLDLLATDWEIVD